MSKYVPYHAPSVAKAKELTKGITDPVEKYRVITEYVNKSFDYDYIRAIKVSKRGELPKIERCWELHMGICYDVAAMTTGMLRGVGLDAYHCIGYADRQWHAWVETTIRGKKYLFDHRVKGEHAYKAEYRFK